MFLVSFLYLQQKIIKKVVICDTTFLFSLNRVFIYYIIVIGDNMKKKLGRVINSIHNKVNNKNKKSKKELASEIERLNGEILKIQTRNNIVERDMYMTFKAIEYKTWQFNNAENQILYDMYIESHKKKKDFNPLVSIIIPVYNGSNYLEEAIKSALAQTYKNIEIIVVNDGSTDGGLSKKVANKFKKQISYYEKSNGGVSSALNYGIKKMKGDYFAWLSHDDLIEPNHISKLVEYISIEGNEKVIPYSSFKVVDKDGYILLNDTIINQIHCFDYKLSVVKNEYSLLQGEINGGSVLIPKEAFKKHGLFAEDQRITQERDMWSRLIKEYHFINVPYDTAIIRSHSSQVTNVNPNIKIETNKKNLEIIKDLSDEVVNRLERNRVSLYTILETFYKNNSNSVMVEEIEKLIEIEKNKNHKK